MFDRIKYFFRVSSAEFATASKQYHDLQGAYKIANNDFLSICRDITADVSFENCTHLPQACIVKVYSSKMLNYGMDDGDDIPVIIRQCQAFEKEDAPCKNTDCPHAAKNAQYFIAKQKRDQVQQKLNHFWRDKAARVK